MTALNGGTSGDQGLLGGFCFFFLTIMVVCRTTLYLLHISLEVILLKPPPRLLSWPLHPTHKVISRPERGTEA